MSGIDDIFGGFSDCPTWLCYNYLSECPDAHRQVVKVIESTIDGCRDLAVNRTNLYTHVQDAVDRHVSDLIFDLSFNVADTLTHPLIRSCIAQLYNMIDRSAVVERIIGDYRRTLSDDHIFAEGA